MNESQNILFLKIISIFGILGPCVFSLVLTLLGHLWTDYNPYVDVMSALGAENAPTALFMNIFGFAFLGISMILFSIGLFKSIKKHVFTTFSVILLLLSGIILFLLGFIHCDPGCLHTTISAQAHKYMTFVAIFTIPIAIITLIYPLWRDKKWGKSWLYFPLELVIFFATVLPLTLIPGVLMLVGLLQRLGMALILLWMFLMSIKLYFIAKIGNMSETKGS